MNYNQAFYAVIAAGSKFRVVYTDGKVIVATKPQKYFATVPGAKQYWIKEKDGINPVRCFGREVRFDRSNPVHAALAAIEYRHNPHGEIMAVGTSHYMKRRSTLGIEERIQYRVVKDMAQARKDSEMIHEADTSHTA